MARIVPGSRERRRRWLEGPERVEHALARLAGARSKSDAAATLWTLDRAERVVALGTAASGPIREAIRWWEREGRSIETAIDGHRLVELGVRPGPGLGRALRAARHEAWNGGGADAQLAAARRALTLGEDDSV
ncbi:MAG: hypothetical protein OEQ13_03530 [Acidobacteriota bacterium]|nr:hypothetical protein [Acidobacteriota bacterium]